MSPRRLGLAALASWFAGAGLLIAACSGEERPPAADEQQTGSEGGSGAAEAGADGGSPGGGLGSAGDGSAGEGSAGEASGGAGPGGAAGAGGAGTCGDGVRGGEEQCDAEDTGGVRCFDLGFDEGTLGCNADCTFDVTECVGIEDCHDSLDNDGDGRADCLDLDDCRSVCADPCSDAPLLADPDVAWGTTEGSANRTRSSCSEEGTNSGSEVAYEFIAANSGLLSISLQTSALLNVSVRSGCYDAGTEFGCDYEGLRVPIAEGERVVVVVEGRTDSDAGSFKLSVESKPMEACGNGFWEEGEECDDGAQFPGDGCDETCRLESSEDEESTNTYANPFYGQISPEGDVDVVEVTVTEPGSTMTAETLNVNIGACAAGLMDSYVEVIGPDSSTVISSDDDGADGECARALAWGLEPDTYYVAVSAADDALVEHAVFPYRLYVAVDPCGNGTVAAGEECDDGNTTNGDGCSEFCRDE